MSTPESGIGSPRWWLDKLSTELNSRQARMQLMSAYYCGGGDHYPLPFLTAAHHTKMHKEFSNLLTDSRSNFMRLVVDAVEERLRVEGFRLSAASDQAADKESWRIWQANEMDAESQVAFLEALIKGVSYLSVWKEDGDDYPTIAVEDALQTIVGYAPGSNYRKRAAALKVWRDDWTGKIRANVYLPEGIYKFERNDDRAQTMTTANPMRVDISAESQSSWDELPDGFVKNPLGLIPVVPLRNRPRLLLEGESELADVYRVQNQINGFLFLLALAGYFGAHRQRWVVGLKLFEDDKGNMVEPFRTAVDTLWQAEDGNVKFGEFEQTDLDGYIKAIEQKVLHIAVTTRTPRHYLIQEGQSPSGDAIKSAESGLVKKVERKQRPFGEGLEDALRLARLFNGEKDVPVDSEIVWADAEVRSEAEITDAVIKKYQAKLISRAQALEDLGYSPQAIERIEADVQNEQPPVVSNPAVAA